MKTSASPLFDHASSSSREPSGALRQQRGFKVEGQATPSRHRLADIALTPTESASPENAPVQRRQAQSLGQPAAAPAGRGALPAELQSGVESLSGVSMAGVRVHYNSPKPTQLRAEAYAQGKDIHIAPGREQHLPHEAWHLAQQGQGRVQATMQAKGLPINDSEDLEKEADVMGAKALQVGRAQVNAQVSSQAKAGPSVQSSAGVAGPAAAASPTPAAR